MNRKEEEDGEKNPEMKVLWFASPEKSPSGEKDIVRRKYNKLYVHKEKENQGWLFILISEDFALFFISAEMYFSKVVRVWSNFRKVGAAETTKSYRYRIPNRNNNPIFFFFFFKSKG